MNWGNSSSNARVQLVQLVQVFKRLNYFKGISPSKLSWLVQLNLSLAQFSPSLFYIILHYNVLEYPYIVMKTKAAEAIQLVVEAIF